MSLVPLYFDGGENGYRRIIADDWDVEYFYSMGAVKHPSDLEDGANTFELDTDPVKGWGKPGSLRWHNAHILSCDTIHELYDYILAVTGQKMSKIGALYNLKRNANKRIKVYLNDQSK